MRREGEMRSLALYFPYAIFILSCVLGLCRPFIGYAEDHCEMRVEREHRERAIAVYGAAIERHGLSTDSVNDLVVAFREAPVEDYLLRESSLTCMTYQFESEAVPLLYEALGDPSLSVRMRAASLLGELGDNSGRTRMVEDYEYYLQAAGTIQRGESKKFPVYLDGLPQGELRPVNREALLSRVLRIGEILAGLGDLRVRDVALESVTSESPEEGGSLNVRKDGIKAFNSVAANRSNEGNGYFDFAKAYAQMADAETESIMNWVDLIGGIRDNLPYDEKVSLLGQIMANKKYSAEFHDFTAYILRRVKEQKE
jgi:hypothetical protein